MKPGGYAGKLLRWAILSFLLVTWLTCAGCLHSEKLVVVTSDDLVEFVAAGAMYQNNTAHERVVISKGAYIELMEAAENSLLKEK